MGVAKVDYQINSKQSLFARYFGTHSLQPSSFLPASGELSVANAGTDDTVSSLVLGHTYLISTAMLNTFHFTYNQSRHHEISGADSHPHRHRSRGHVHGSAPLFQHQHHRRLPERRRIRYPRPCQHQYMGVKGRLQPGQGPPSVAVRVQLSSSQQTSTFCVYCNGLFTFSGAVNRQGHVGFHRRGARFNDPDKCLARQREMAVRWGSTCRIAGRSIRA